MGRKSEYRPSSYPLSPKILNAAASRPFRYSRSCILSSNTGLLGICIFTAARSAPTAWDDWGACILMLTRVSVADGGAIVTTFIVRIMWSVGAEGTKLQVDVDLP